jgi:phosphatidylserine decarboxylase
VCRLAAGTDVRAGERYGVMKFGSRMDVFVPPDAEVDVRVGDRVRAAETVLARLPAGTDR